MSLKTSLITLCLGFFSFTAYAQEGLHVESLFEGEIVPLAAMRQSTIRGPQLSPYKLDIYRSLSFTVDDNVFRTVERLVLQDTEEAVDLRMETDGGHLVYAVITASPLPDGSNRFICFQAVQQKRSWAVTLVYLRGSAEVSDLDKMFNKKSDQ